MPARIVAGDGHRARGPPPPRRCPGHRRPGPARPASTQRSGGDRRGQHVADGGDPDAASAASWSATRHGRVVGDEDDAAPLGPQPGDGVDRAGDRLVGQPHHPVEVTEHGHAGPRALAHRTGRRGTARMAPCPASNRSAPSATPPTSISTPSSPRPTTCCPTRDVDALADRDPHNIVHVDVPRGGPDRYEQAGTTLRPLDRRRHPGRRRCPTFTLYRMRFTDAAGVDRDLVGVLGGLEIVDEGAGGVLPHERTTPKASTDRLDLTRATEANLSPVWGLSLASGLTAAAGRAGGAGRRGHRRRRRARRRAGHRPRPDRRDHAPTSAADDVLIADGHHRYGISRTYRDEVRAPPEARRHARPSRRWPSSASWSPSSSASRRSTGCTRDRRPTDVRAALAGSFELAPAGRRRRPRSRAMQPQGRLVLVGPDGSAEWLTPPRRRVRRRPRRSTGRGSSTPWPARPAEVTYQHGLDEVVAAVAVRRGRRRPCSSARSASPRSSAPPARAC